MRFLLPLACLALTALPASAQLPKGSGTVVLRAAHLIDGTGAPAIDRGVVVVTDDRIVAVGREGSVLTPMQSIVAGTMSAAKLLGWDRNVGSLTTGKWADVVAVPGDPLADIHRMENTVFVMKNGVVYKAPSGIPTAM
jgi:imidazolonepropionase-like amidohydrolase